MSPKNLLIFSIIGIILLLAIFLGIVRRSSIRSGEPAPETTAASIPYLGPVQVLNGCGIAGAGDQMADFLRARNFDVKNIGNAPESNYPYTLVISRSKNMTIAHQLESALHTGHCVLMRNGEETYVATVIIGPDYEERIQ
ncbi:MAG: LytR C-terminal domain-containing protein [Chitinispirillaceae bacterium]|jgi:hypothetical protein